MDTYKCNQADYHGEIVRLRKRIEELEAQLLMRENLLDEVLTRLEPLAPITKAILDYRAREVVDNGMILDPTLTR